MLCIRKKKKEDEKYLISVEYCIMNDNSKSGNTLVNHLLRRYFFLSNINERRPIAKTKLLKYNSFRMLRRISGLPTLLFSFSLLSLLSPL